MKNMLIPSVLSLSLLTFGACHGHGPDADHSHESTEPSATQPEASITYVPAYPEDVSKDPLSEVDIEQQEATHSHGDEEHSHGDDIDTHGDDSSHEHDGDEGHDHDDSDADHAHGR